MLGQSFFTASMTHLSWICLHLLLRPPVHHLLPVPLPQDVHVLGVEPHALGHGWGQPLPPPPPPPAAAVPIAGTGPVYKGGN